MSSPNFTLFPCLLILTIITGDSSSRYFQICFLLRGSLLHLHQGAHHSFCGIGSLHSVLWPLDRRLLFGTCAPAHICTLNVHFTSHFHCPPGYVQCLCGSTSQSIQLRANDIQFRALDHGSDVPLLRLLSFHYHSRCCSTGCSLVPA